MPEGAELDMRYGGYSLSDIYSRLHDVELAGRQAYVQFLWIDFIFIIVFAILVSLIFSALARKAGLGKKTIVNLLPFLRGILDMIENILILTLISRYPSQLHAVAAVASFVTVSKFVVLGVVMATLVWLGVVAIMFQIKSENEK